MKMSTGRHIIGGLVVSGFTAFAMLMGTSVAAAGPLDSPLINSTCSFGQIDRALHVERPDLAARLDADPQQKANMQRLFDQPVPQRRAEIERYMNEHPNRSAQMRQRQAMRPDLMNDRYMLGNQLANTCHSY